MCIFDNPLQVCLCRAVCVGQHRPSLAHTWPHRPGGKDTTPATAVSGTPRAGSALRPLRYSTLGGAMQQAHSVIEVEKHMENEN